MYATDLSFLLTESPITIRGVNTTKSELHNLTSVTIVLQIWKLRVRGKVKPLTV